jgi:hypothetical protein
MPRELEIVQSLFDEFERTWVLPFRRISSSQLTPIIDRVRSTVLDWALELEAKGIMGKDMTFTPDEQNRASNIHIGSFQGILGNVTNSSVSQNLEMNVSHNDFESLREMLLGMKIPEAEISSLKSALDEDEPPKDKGRLGARVSGWIGGVAGKIASGTYKLAMDAAREQITRGISQYYCS